MKDIRVSGRQDEDTKDSRSQGYTNKPQKSGKRISDGEESQEPEEFSGRKRETSNDIAMARGVCG